MQETHISENLLRQPYHMKNKFKRFEFMKRKLLFSFKKDDATIETIEVIYFITVIFN